jgi:hypothetical protein
MLADSPNDAIGWGHCIVLRDGACFTAGLTLVMETVAV